MEARNYMVLVCWLFFPLPLSSIAYWATGLVQMLALPHLTNSQG